MVHWVRIVVLSCGFCLQKRYSVVLETLLVVLGRGGDATSVREARGVDKHPAVHNPAPCTESYPAQNVSSVEVEDSCVG